MGIALTVIGSIIVLAAIGYGIFETVKFKKDASIHALSKKDLLTFIALLGLIALGGILLQLGIAIHLEWAMTPLHMVMAVAGMAIFLPSLFAFYVGFFLYYWKPTLRPDQRKWVRRILFFGVAGAVVFFLLMAEGAAPYIHYPLYNAFHIGGNGIFSTYIGGATGGLKITFYGLFIVSGALIALAISDHKMYQKFGQHGLLDSTFLIGFLAGIICARIGYVIGNWNGDTAGGINFSQQIASGNWTIIFEIWNGGLTILGGAIGGILFGALWVQFNKKTKTIGARTVLDVAVPTILLAQAIGRWGNFFNHEVYGAEVPMSSMWFLPTWLRNQMSVGFPVSDTGYVPLFLIEGLINVAGYFIIVYLIGKLLKNWLHRGDFCGFYLMWYGIVRLVMEPLRDPSFNMGSDGKWSIIWSIVYIGGGALLIVALHLFDYLYYTKRGKPIYVPKCDGIVEYGWLVPSYEEAVGQKKESASQEGEDAPINIEEKK